jgi:hypothetical protein
MHKSLKIAPKPPQRVTCIDAKGNENSVVARTRESGAA